MQIRDAAGRTLEIGGRTRVMGIVNVTPDSFFDGGRWQDVGAAAAHAEQLVAEGADMLDVGGESTRPGHDPVSVEEQIRRVEPVIRELARRVSVPISIDTTKSDVARAAIDAGAGWINDTKALRDDPELAHLAASTGSPLVLMHRFEPERSTADDASTCAREIASNLAPAIAAAREAGVPREHLLLDPGIGFGTTHEDSLALHRDLEPLREPGLPLLFGTSRKRFLGHVTGRETADRLLATAASCAWLAAQGVEILRIHDVAAVRDVVLVIDSIKEAR